MNFVYFLTLLAIGFSLIVNETDAHPPIVEQYDHMTAQFGVQADDSTYQRTAPLVVMQPDTGCDDIENGDELNGAIVLVKRGDCKYVDKAYNVANYGGIGMVVGNDDDKDSLVWMSKPIDSKDVYIPCVFVTKSTYDAVVSAISNDTPGSVIGTISLAGDVPSPNLWSFPNLMRLITYLLIVFPAVWAILTIKHFCPQRCRDQDRRRIRNCDIPDVLFTKDLLDPDTDAEYQMRRRKTRLTNTSCPICLENFEEQIKIKLLPCEHGFHSECIGPWIADQNDSCPICRQNLADQLLDYEPRTRCWCCHWWVATVPNDDELRQPLIEPLILSDADEEEVDIEAPDVESIVVEEKQEEPNTGALSLSLQRLDGSVPVDSPEYPIGANEKNQPNSIEEDRLSLSQATGRVGVKDGDTKHDGERKEDNVS